MRNIEVAIRQLFWAIKRTFSPTTHDAVLYKNKVYFIRPSGKGHDRWNLFKSFGRPTTFRAIKGEDLQVLHSFKRTRFEFKSKLAFQHGYWGDIDRRSPIGTRLSYNNADDISFHSDKNEKP
jgi:hypothetical protein